MNHAKSMNTIKATLVFSLAFTSYFLLSQDFAVAGVVDSFWTVVYWVGDSLSKTSVGQFIENGFDGVLQIFGIHLAAYVEPDYWGSLTGTLSKEVGSSFKIPNGSSLECKVLEPRMHRESTNTRWVLDDSATKYLENCYEKVRKVADKAIQKYRG